jgi:hypothetical protein
MSSVRTRVAIRATYVVSLAALGILGSACESEYRHRYLTHSDKVTLGAGDASAANVAAQTVNPWPATSERTRIDQDGKRAHIAAKRYETNTSIPPRGVNVTNGANGSAGLVPPPPIAVQQ